MNPKITLFIATSSDGFIADKDGNVDWLTAYNESLPGEDYGYTDFFNSIDTIVMGENTYKQIVAWNVWLYEGKRVFVFTYNELPNPFGVTFITGNMTQFLALIHTSKDIKNIWLLGGAALVKSFNDARLIDDCIITVMPTKLGQGILLPQELFLQDRFVQTSSKEYANGVKEYRSKKLR